MSDILRKLAEEGNNHPDKVNEMLEIIAEKLDKHYDTTNDKGTDALMTDLTELLDEAFHYEFHDFKNKKYATPKVELYKRLMALAENVKNGKYDN